MTEGSSAVISLLLELSKLSGEALKEREVAERLARIQSGLDELLLRELRSAYDALGDALISQNAQTQSIRLGYAEESLLRNSNLDPTRRTGQYENKSIMALAHFGLAHICALRSDSPLAAKHLLKVFALDPREARTRLAPEVFREVFLPKCADITTWYDQSLAAINRDSFAWHVFGRKASAVAIGASAVLGAIAAGLARQRVPPTVFRAFERTLNDSNPEEFRKAARERLRDEHENRLDAKCREVAQSLAA